MIEADWEAATAAYLVLKGHTFEYFFGLSMTEKVMCHVAMEKERNERLEVAKLAMKEVFGVR